MSDARRILFIGGHGKVARLATPLLARDHLVTSVIRTAGQSEDIERAGGRPRVADLQSLDQQGFVDLIDGQDAVVWSAGAGGGSPERTYAIDRDAAIRSIDAAQVAGVRRFVMVSYFGAGPNHGVPEDNSFFPYAEAKAAADAHLEAADLDWTILRPSALTDEPGTGGIDLTATESGSVSRADVGATIAAVLPETSSYRQIYQYNSGNTPIASAFR